MKKIFLGLSALILISFFACKKTAESTTEPVKALKSESPMTLDEAKALGLSHDSSHDIEEQPLAEEKAPLSIGSRLGALSKYKAKNSSSILVFNAPNF